MPSSVKQGIERPVRRSISYLFELKDEHLMTLDRDDERTYGSLDWRVGLEYPICEAPNNRFSLDHQVYARRR